MNGERVKKMTLQLTPLLDLLLIVIFAQYLEVQETQETIEQTASTAVTERDEAIASLSQLKDSFQEMTARLTLAQGELSEKSEALTSAKEQLEQTRQQQEQIGDLVVELFRVPQQDVNAALNPNAPPPGRTAAEIERLKERFRQIAVEQSGRVIEHLLSYEEIRKRCDVWDVHVQPDNFLTLSSGEKVLKMQIPIDISRDFVQDEFITKFIETAHTLPEPKSLVIMMLTYDRKSQRWATQGIRETLPEIVLELNRTSDGRTRYDHADLGFRIE